MSLLKVLLKLRAGKAITVLAFGSSVTAGCGGQFESRPGLIAALAPYAPPLADYARDGWLRMFMQVINTTWPHPGKHDQEQLWGL